MPSGSSGVSSGQPWAPQPLANGMYSPVKRLSDPTTGVMGRVSEGSSMSAIDRASAPGYAPGAPAGPSGGNLRAASVHSVPPTPPSPCCDWPDQVIAMLAQLTHQRLC